MRLIKHLVVSILLLYSVSFFGQTSLIGKISNESGEPVANSLVYLDTIKTEAKSNAVGYFEVQVPEGVKNITLYSPKYGYLTADYDNEERLSFVFMEPKEKEEDAPAIMVDGFEEGVDIAKDNNSLNLRSDENVASYRDIYEYIRGKVAGVTVSNSNEIFIRGGSSWDLSNEPLFVVDGIVVNSIDQISPMDIDRIDVLKGVDTSMYGSRGSNGVLEITTKE